MEEIVCCSCGDVFERSVRHKNQRYCPKLVCQRARKAAWKRYKMHTDPDYKFNQTVSNKNWAKAKPGYWKDYRRRHPEKTERNRILQSIRNRRRTNKQNQQSQIQTELIAKVDASIVNKFKVVGQYWLVPVIAKVDALKVNIFDIPLL
jgi:uncharacterized protein (DUF4415 family)